MAFIVKCCSSRIEVEIHDYVRITDLFELFETNGPEFPVRVRSPGCSQQKMVNFPVNLSSPGNR